VTSLPNQRLALSTIYASITVVLLIALETPSAMWPVYLLTGGLVVATVWCSLVALRELRRGRGLNGREDR
jgi:hypothetical protein